MLLIKASKFVRCYTIKKQQKDDNDNVENIIQRDLNDQKQTLPTNSKFIKSQIESKSSEKMKDFIANMEKKNFDLNQGILLEEDTILIRKALSEHFLFVNLSEDIM